MKPKKFSYIINGLSVGAATFAGSLMIDRLPDHFPLPPAEVPLVARSVALVDIGGPLKLSGAWELQAIDPRFGGISALTLDGGRFHAVTDRGAVVRFGMPTDPNPKVGLADLNEGPGPFARKWARDAESLVRDPQGRGWWVGYEQRHSLWLYDKDFGRALASVDLRKTNWLDNRGAEGLAVRDGRLLVLGENGRDAIEIGSNGPRPVTLHSNAEIADAAKAPDGGIWVLLRRIGPAGIDQAIAPLLKSHDGFKVGPARPVPKARLDNYDGMAIEARAEGWRFWLISDDGHRIAARTLLVALDLIVPVRHGKSPARRTGLSKKLAVETP